MKTSELVVEQVFVGLLVLGVLTLPFLPDGLPADSSRLLAIAAALGVPSVGLAYLLGVVFDRFADTLLSRLEQRARIQFVIDPPKHSKNDPFPEDLIRVRVMSASETLGEWMDYLRKRIRIARSLAVFLPALTLSAALAILGERWPVLPPAGLALIAMVYAAAFCTTLRDNRDGSPRELPRTDDPGAEGTVSKLSLYREPAVLGALGLGFVSVVILLAAALAAELRNGLLVLLVLVGGAALSALSVWSWRRITRTFMNLLEACGHERIGRPDGKVHNEPIEETDR